MTTVGAVTPAGVSPDQITKLRQAAQDFEAMTLNQLFAPVFDTVDTADTMFGGGAAETAFRPMLVEAISRQIAAHGGLGLAGPIFDCLLRAQESASGAALQ